MALIEFLTHTVTATIDFFGTCQKLQTKFGDPFYLHLAYNKPILLAGNEAAARLIFTAKKDSFKAIDADPMSVLLSQQALILKYGTEHIHHKGIFLPFFYAPEKLANYQKIIEQRVIKTINKWQVGQNINLSEEMVNLTLSIIIEVVFGAANAIEIQEFMQKTQNLLNAYSPLVMFVPILRQKYLPHWYRFTKAKQIFEKACLDKITAARLQPQKNNSILAQLANLKQPNGEYNFSANYLLSQLLTLLIAGHDTTANSLIWALIHVLRDTEVKNKLLHELAANSTSPKKDKITYLDLVCKEVLRLHPPVPMIIRTLNQPMNFLGIPCAENSTIGLSIHLLQNNPAIWHQPTIFTPERFLSQAVNQFNYCPFSGGLKKCLGSSFAMLEIKIILAMILQRCDLELTTSTLPKTKVLGLVVGPKTPTIVKVSKITA